MTDMVESYYVLRNCCGDMLDISSFPIPHTSGLCETCRDWDIHQEFVRIVRADVSEPISAAQVDLASVGVSFATILEIDAIGAEEVYVVPHNYSMCSNSPRLYGRFA